MIELEVYAAGLRDIDKILELGGAVAAVESGYLKSALVSSHALRRRRIESGEDVVPQTLLWPSVAAAGVLAAGLLVRRTAKGRIS